MIQMKIFFLRKQKNMRTPKDYIIFPLDFSDMEKARPYISMLSGEVGMFKIGLELFIKQGPEIVRFIKSSADAGIFLDLKLHDIPETVSRAMKRIASLGVDLATVHCGENPDMLKAAVKGSGGKTKVLGVTVLTSVSGKDLSFAGFRDEFSEDISKLVSLKAKMAYDAGCHGVVCSGLEAGKIKKAFGKNFLAVTPGIRPEWACDAADQKRITTPSQAVEHGADYIVTGRPIRDTKDPKNAARMIALEIEKAI